MKSLVRTQEENGEFQRALRDCFKMVIEGAVPKTTHRTEGESTAEQSGAMPSFDRPFPEAEDAFPPPVLPGRRLRAPVAPAALPGPTMATLAALPGSKMAAAAGGTSRGRERAAQPRWWRREAAGRRLLLPSARPGPGMEVEKMDENEWKYHGEGNQSLVVSHCQRCVVLRFLKSPPNQNKTPEEILHHLQNIVDFGKHVMKQFFGENYVHHGEIIQLPLDFVRQLCLKIQPERPECRCDKDMDTLSGYAMCLPNLTRLQPFRLAEHRPILCIEIKPKCGFIPFSSHVSQEIKHKVCRYCMHQHLKVANGKWKRPSKYCPLDLFSGNKQRMHFALKSLLQEAQNNLKIFKNGELIYGCKDDQDCVCDWNELAHHLKPFFFPCNGLASGPQCTRTVVKELIHVITTALLSSTDSCRAGHMKTVPLSQGRSYCEASAFNKELVRNGKHKLESSGLPRGCLLYKTLQAQMLDMLDIEGLYPLYSRVEQYLEEFPEERSTLQIDGPYNEAFYEKLLDLSLEDDGTVAFALTKVQQYRIAMTAKDCSIMIALSPCLQDECSEQRSVVLTSKSRFTFSVSVLDLDLKPYESIPHQYKLDGEIVNYYLKNVQAKEDPVMSNLFKENEDCTLVLHKV